MMASEIAVCGVFVGGDGEVLVAAVSPLRTFGCFANRPDSIVHGTLHAGGGVRLTELSLAQEDPVREYAFHLRRTADNAVLLEGAASDSPRPVALLLSPDGVLSCARFTGSADPDASLADFALPRNPIAWVLARLADGRAVGAGYFDDSADVPGKSTLLFRLEGRWGVDGSLVLEKKYEFAAREYAVRYEGRWSAGLLEGTWRNAAAGSFGSFNARETSAENEVVALCEGCDACLAPGAPRWRREKTEKTDAAAVWCEGCRERLPDRDQLVPDVFSPLRQALGSSCRQLLRNALAEFGTSVLFGAFSEDGTLEEHKYGEALAAAARLQFPQTIGENSVVVVCGPLNWQCVVATISCVLRGVPLASLEHAGLVDRCCAGLQVGAVFDCTKGLTFDRDPNVDFDRPLQHEPDPETIVAYLPTSGTSGAVPRLARFSDALCLPAEGLVSTSPFIRADVGTFDPSFLPSLLSTARFGGSRYQCSLARLSEQFLRIRPTHFGAPPAVWQMIVKHKMGKKALGGRLTVVTSGGASLAPEVAKDLRILLGGIGIVSLYGTRETGGVARDGKVYRGVHVLVRPIDENAQTFGEKMLGNGVGEVLVCTPRLVDGYHGEKSSENRFFFVATKKYYATGDYGILETSPDDGGQRLQIVDRCVDRAKLGNGKWFAPRELEEKLEFFSPHISQAFVWADEMSGGLRVAIVLANSDYKSLALQDAQMICSGFAPGQSVAFVISPVVFSAENGLLTATQKKKRRALREYFANICSEKVEGEAVDSLDDRLHKCLAENDYFGGRAPNQLSSIECAKIVMFLRENNFPFSSVSLVANSPSWKVLNFALLRHADASRSFIWAEEIDFLAQDLEKHLPNVSPAQPQTRVCVLIGATGFLGTHLRQTLAKYFSEVICPVRPYDLQSVITERVSDVVLSAAHVSAKFPYEKLREANVELLVNVLQIVGRTGARIHFVSSVGAMGGSREEEYMPVSQELMDSKSGYGQSKAVCEGVLHRLRHRLSCRVYRMGTIGPDTVTGRPNAADPLCHLWRVSRDIGGAVPRDRSLNLRWVPVDLLAAAMARVASLPDAALAGQWVFHFQTDTPRLAEVLVGESEVTQREWRDRVGRLLADPRHPSHPFRDVLLGVEFAGTDSGGVGTTRTDALHGLSLRYTPEMLKQIREELAARLDSYVPPAPAL